MTVNSPDITILITQTTFDIAGTSPVISLVNLSAGPNLAGTTTWFVVTAPGGIPIHEGSESSPDITGEWSDFVLTDPWPRSFNNIIWSGAQYQISTFVKDSAGNIFQFDQAVAICRPAGNKPTSTNTLGLGTASVQVQCQQARVFFQDTTFHQYKGLDGTLVASVLRVQYPIDETGNVPPPFVGVNFTAASVPITYSSDNYQFQSYSVYDYDFGNYTHVRIKYQSFNPVNGAPAVRFAVLCNIDLCALFCEVDKLVRSIEDGSCANAQEANNKLALINPKINLILIGIQQPLCGIDVPLLIEEVKRIGGFTCDCCNAPTGIIPTTTSVIDGYNFQVTTSCGDTTGNFNKVGNNITLTLNGITYTFGYCDESPAQTTAFSLTKSVDGCIASVCLNVDMTQLAFDLANTIKSNGDLVNLWQSILNSGAPGDFDLIVDGGCIFQNSATCDYSLTLSNIPINTTYALLNSIQVAGVVHPISYSFNLTNLPGLQTYLNSLGYGTFAVTNPSGQTVLITSTANPNNIQALTYKISGTTYIADLAKNCTGYVPISANQVVQNIINYICGITDAQVSTSAQYEICYIDPADGTAKTETLSAGVPLANFIAELLARGCDTINYVKTLVGNTCAGMKALFPSTTEVMQANDYLFGTKNAGCARILPVELGTRIMQLGISDATFMNAFCAAVAACGGGLPCAPYNQFYVTITPFDSSCPDIIGFDYTFNGSTLDINKVDFANTPGSIQNITVEYKLNSDSSYTLYNASVNINTNGTPAAPIAISLTAGQTYQIRLTNNCSSPPAHFVQTVNVPGNPVTVRITSSMGGVTLTAVNNLTGFTLGAPLNPGGTATGTHAAFTGNIQLVVSGTPVINPSGAILKRNGIQIACVDITGPGSYNFGSFTYALTDYIEIQLLIGSPC